MTSYAAGVGSKTSSAIPTAAEDRRQARRAYAGNGQRPGPEGGGAAGQGEEVPSWKPPTVEASTVFRVCRSDVQRGPQEDLPFTDWFGQADDDAAGQPSIDSGRSIAWMYGFFAAPRTSVAFMANVELRWRT